MNEIFVKESTLSKAYNQALVELHKHGTKLSNNFTREIGLTLVVEFPDMEPMISKCFLGGPYELEHYRAKIINGLLDPKENFDSNAGTSYHQRITNYIEYDAAETKHTINQIDFVVKELKKDPSSRRAIIDLRDNYTDTLDPANSPVISTIQFFNRDNLLDCTITSRSCDSVKAAFIDLFTYIFLQQKIATQLDLDIGTFTFRANSFHVYESDFKYLETWVNEIQTAYDKNHKYSVASNYIGSWDQKLADAANKIKKELDRGLEV